jgi:hypothetical protein
VLQRLSPPGWLAGWLLLTVYCVLCPPPAGHCAGLRVSQNLGDYVLAHAYVREDHVLDQVGGGGLLSILWMSSSVSPALCDHVYT